MQPIPQGQIGDSGTDAGGSGSPAGRPTDVPAQPREVPAQPGAALDLGVLDTLAERPAQEHAAVYDDVHAQLQRALSEIDDA